MGVIQKQSIRGTVYTYGGAVLGFIISGILFPNYLSTSQIGVINVVVSYSTIFALLASLGFLSTTTKFFPFFRNKEKRHNGFIFLGSTVSFIGFLLTLCVFLLLKPIITRSGIGDNVLFEQYTDLIIPLAFFILYFNFFDYINKDLFQATRGLFLRDFLMRILIIGSTFLFAYNFVDFDDFTNLYVLVYSIPVIVLIFYLIVDGNFSLRPSRKFLNKSLVKNMISVSFFGILTSSTGIITQHIDRIMVKDLLNFSEAGIYTTCFFFGTLVALPSRALIRISSSVIADSFKQGNLMLIKNIYSKSVLNQFIIGLYLFIGIWVNIDSIFVILGEEFISGKWVIFLISIAFLTDMLSGTSSNIIGNSAFYRFQSIFMTIMVAIVIVTNIIFIPLYGIVGAALSSLIAKLIFNLLKFFFLWKKLDLQPYDKKILISVLIALITMIIGVIIPSNSYFIFDILIRSIAVSIIFGCSIYYSKVSVDINKFILQLKEKLI
jgi:O-antigen/teichoic acid export membrane protein